MTSPQSDKIFSGSIPKLYEEYLVPMSFEPYAEGLAKRLATRKLARVLEIAAGTGIVTRHLASVPTGEASIIATDLNQSMLDLASENLRDSPRFLNKRCRIAFNETRNGTPEVFH